MLGFGVEGGSSSNKNCVGIEKTISYGAWIT
jgi:hypothetical protein